jgi:uncharacterized protein (TIGR03086 family)
MTRPTTPWTGLDRSLDALAVAVDGLGPADLAAPTPCAGWTVTHVLQHAAGDQLGYVACQGVGDGPGFDPFSPSGDPAEPPLAELVATAVALAADTWSRVDPAGADVPTPLPQGALAPEIAAGAAALDAAIHAWDVAVALGRPSPLDDELAAWLHPIAEGLVEPLRQWGVYAAALPAAGDGAAADLLRYLGRDPAWTAA